MVDMSLHAMPYSRTGGEAAGKAATAATAASSAVESTESIVQVVNRKRKRRLTLSEDQGDPTEQSGPIPPSFYVPTSAKDPVDRGAKRPCNRPAWCAVTAPAP